MKKLLKKIFKNSPLFTKRATIHIREFVYQLQANNDEKKNYLNLPNTQGGKEIKNILLYHISGMFYAGTEKNLQLIANQLVSDYKVFYMYSKDGFSQQQKDAMDPRVNLIEFSYENVSTKFPHFISGMTPHIKNIIHDEKIDLLITSSSGHAQYPFNVIKNIPIILINIFGSPSLQKNIISTVFISKTIQDYSETYTGKKKTNTWEHLAVTGKDLDAPSIRKKTRERHNIPESSFVFGRIGRKSDAIFDPIGIESFKHIVKKYPDTYYLIMSPPPILEKMVEEEQIRNVRFMRDTEDIWDFYYSLDALAHFRKDGETFGLNIAEAMYAYNPIISHVSHIWNAHLEYLTNEFSRVAQKDNVKEYTMFMDEFITLKKDNPTEWEKMRNLAHKTAIDSFNKERYGEKIKTIIRSFEQKTTEK